MRVLGEARGSRKCRIFIWQRDRTGQDRTGQVHLHEVHLPGLNHSPESPSLAETIICYLICTSAGCGRGYPGSQAARRPSFHPGCLPVRLSWTAGSQSARMSEHRQVRESAVRGPRVKHCNFPAPLDPGPRWMLAGWLLAGVGPPLVSSIFGGCNLTAVSPGRRYRYPRRWRNGSYQDWTDWLSRWHRCPWWGVDAAQVESTKVKFARHSA